MKTDTTLLQALGKEAVLDEMRRGWGDAEIIRRGFPGVRWQASEPEPSYLVLDASGAAVAHCSKQCLPRYEGRPGLRFSEKRPSWQSVANWRRWSALLREAAGLRQEFEDANLIAYRDVSELDRHHPIYRVVADALGAERWRKVGRDDVLHYAAGFGGRGHEFISADGYAFLDIGVEDGNVYLPQVALERRGTGLGTRVMEAIRDFAVDNRHGVIVYKVCNPGYFARFDWLEGRDGEFRMATHGPTWEAALAARARRAAVTEPASPKVP